MTEELQFLQIVRCITTHKWKESEVRNREDRNETKLRFDRSSLTRVFVANSFPGKEGQLRPLVVGESCKSEMLSLRLFVQVFYQREI